MFSALLPVVVVLVLLDSRGQQSAQARRSARCEEVRAVCIDLDTLDRLLHHVSQGVNDSMHDERILLELNTFGKLTKKRKLHGCVLLRILDFFEEVLDVRGGHVPLKTFLNNMQHCVKVRNKTCGTFYQEANKIPGNQSLPLSKLKPKEMAVVQLRLLQAASHKLSETAMMNKALTELKGLRGYVKGNGWRSWGKKDKKQA